MRQSSMSLNRSSSRNRQASRRLLGLNVQVLVLVVACSPNSYAGECLRISFDASHPEGWLGWGEPTVVQLDSLPIDTPVASGRGIGMTAAGRDRVGGWGGTWLAIGDSLWLSWWNGTTGFRVVLHHTNLRGETHFFDHEGVCPGSEGDCWSTSAHATLAACDVHGEWYYTTGEWGTDWRVR